MSWKKKMFGVCGWSGLYAKLSRNRTCGKEVRLGSDAGSSLVEFAVSASVLFLVLFGIIEMCFALYIYDYVSDAARVGTRWASVRGTGCNVLTPCPAGQSDIQSYLQSVPYPGINSGSLTATVKWFQLSTSPTNWTVCPTPCQQPKNEVQVTVTYPFPLHIPYFPSGTINIQSTSQMVIAN